MPAVTQRIDNYLGGVSRQSDDKKLPGQVRECLNGYPDPTFGLTKRSGFRWIKNLGTGTTYDGGKWFYIARTTDERYIGVITPKPNSGYGSIAIWNVDGTVCNVTMDTSTTVNAVNYLTGSRLNYSILTVQDTSVIVNNLQTVAKIADPVFIQRTRATLILSETAISSTYSITMNAGGGASDQTFTTTTSSSETYDGLLTTLKNGIDAFNISGLTVTKFQGTLELSRVVSGTRTAFSITCKGGALNNKLTVFQDQVDNVAQLPVQSFHNHVVKVINTSSDKDTYFAKFVADDGISGTGFWEETLDPSKSPGLDASTMPHELVNTALNQFTFRQFTWDPRTVGDDVTNSHPSFVGNKIQQAFFHNNRLGFLSNDNVSMSQSAKYFNFYHTSAQIITDADPIDISSSTIRPANLHAIVPTTQGLVLFSKSQQFLLRSADRVLTPSTTNITPISNYDVDEHIDPVDMGTNINFISKTPSYTRVFGMITRGQDENPQVLDVGRVVNEWIPESIDTLIASPQNQFIAMSDQNSNKVYFYRTYSDGKDTLVQAWFNWELPGTVQSIAIDTDDLLAVTKQANQFTLSKVSLSQSPEDAIIVNNDGQKINPCIDLYAAPTSVAYDSTNNFSKCYLPWNNVTGLTPVLIIKGTTATGQFIESGFSVEPTIASDGGGTYFKVHFKDLTSIASDVIIGWKFDFDVILPKTYYFLDEENKRSDFTASLTIARMKFIVGLSGVMGFKLKSKGVRQGSRQYTGDGSTTAYSWNEDDISYTDADQIKVKLDGVVTTAFTVTNNTTITFNSAPGNGVDILIYLDEWYSLNATIIADQYLANDVPLAGSKTFSLPIHQKTDNFQLRLFNDSPFPVALNSMMWEGHYSPRFYRRT
jgi:hypothetical protein